MFLSFSADGRFLTYSHAAERSRRLNQTSCLTRAAVLTVRFCTADEAGRRRMMAELDLYIGPFPLQEVLNF